MNSSISTLVSEAKAITDQIKAGPGVRYPEKVKRIVRSLAIEHHLSVSKITSLIPVSQYSVRAWADEKKKKFSSRKQKKRPLRFKKISLTKNSPQLKHNSGMISLRPYLIAILAGQALLLIVILFLR